MSNYSPTTIFADKDALPTGNAAKIIKGSEFGAEFTAIATMSATKADLASPTFTGTVSIPTAAIPTANITTANITTANINNISVDGLVAESIDLVDGDKIQLGTGDDLKIYHDGSNSYIEDSGSGNLRILSSNLLVKNPADDETMIKATENDAVELYFDNQKKLETLTNGAKVTGSLIASAKVGVGIDVPERPLHVYNAGTDVVGRFESGDAGAGIEFLDLTTTAQLKVDNGTFTLNTDTAGAAAGSNISLRVDATEKFNIGETITVNKQDFRTNDDFVMSFGSAVDMEIKHLSASNTNVVQNNNSRPMLLNGTSFIFQNQGADEKIIEGTANGSVDLFHNNNKKLETTATGVEVTGDVDTDTLGVTGLATLGSSTVAGVSTTNTLVVDKGTDDIVAEFKKSGTVCGAVRVNQSGPPDVTIGNGDAALRYLSGLGTIAIAPYKMSDNSAHDDAVDLGTGTARFDDIYATNGTINTSDANEKQSIEELTEAETRVAVACKGLIRKFKWNSAVEQKGIDGARYHFGVIAQDVQAAFTAEGLDASDYGLFVSNTWEDESGVEQTRLGVRYTELLAFIIGGL